MNKAVKKMFNGPLSKGGMIEFLKEIGKPVPGSFDYALPQEWVERAEKMGLPNPCGDYIWSYDNDPFGHPFNLTAKFNEELMLLWQDAPKEVLEVVWKTVNARCLYADKDK